MHFLPDYICHLRENLFDVLQVCVGILVLDVPRWNIKCERWCVKRERTVIRYVGLE